jgi:hypothetical protein
MLAITFFIIIIIAKVKVKMRNAFFKNTKKKQIP